MTTTQRTVKSAAYELLAHVDHVDEATGRNVGLPYAEILDRLRKEFPEGQTSEKCLRWYAAKMNFDGMKMPVRPRRPPRRKAKEEKA